MKHIAKSLLSLALGALATHTAAAQDTDVQGNHGQAVRVEAQHSNDSDGTEVTRARLAWDFQHQDIERYRGFEVENVDYTFRDFGDRSSRRGYFRAADTLPNGKWKWNARIGSDGHTWLGDGSIVKDVPMRQEYFFERDAVETPVGVTQGLHSTYVGAAYDFPINDRQVITGLIGVQDFTGDNTRFHLRARYIHVVKPEWGLSAQLRVRHFRNSDPYEYDYFSPKWYAEVLPVVQLRRFHKRWQYSVALGLGRQKHSDSGWYPSRFAEAMITSPKIGKDWFLKSGFTYTESPSTNGSYADYRYRQFRLEFTRQF